MENRQLRVGQIVNTQGIKGEVRIYPLTDYKERFEELKWVYIEGFQQQKFRIEKVKYKSNLVILKLEGIEDLNEAEKFRNKYILIDRQYSRNLPEDTYLIADLINMEVFSEEGILLGVIKDVLQTGGNDIYEICNPERPGKNILIPAVGDFVKEVDLRNKKILVKLIEGMVDED